MSIGVSTGALFPLNIKEAVELLNKKEIEIDAIELSSLRDNSLDYVLNTIPELDLSKYKYISFHAPSKLNILTEDLLIEKLQPIYENGWNIVIHPDIMVNPVAWNCFEEKLLLENMDSRKREGQYLDFFKRLKTHCIDHFNLCFDIAHAIEVDPMAILPEEFLHECKCFTNIKQIHISAIDGNCKHRKIDEYTFKEYTYIFSNSYDEELWDLPFIIESPMYNTQEIINEINLIKDLEYRVKTIVNKRILISTMKAIIE